MLHPPCFSVVCVLEPQYSLLQMPWDRQQSRTLPDFSDVVLAGTGTWLLVWGSQRLQLLVSSCVFVRGGGWGGVQAQWWVRKDVTCKTGVQRYVLIQILNFLFQIKAPAFGLRPSSLPLGPGRREGGAWDDRQAASPICP